MNPRIVCAANRNKHNAIVLGARHYDLLMRAAIDDYMDANLEWLSDNDDFTEEGFIDQYGVFYTRTEAWKLAVSNNQIVRRCGGDDIDGGTLYSENLY